jgi:hypothetical protein
MVRCGKKAGLGTLLPPASVGLVLFIDGRWADTFFVSTPEYDSLG